MVDEPNPNLPPAKPSDNQKDRSDKDRRDKDPWDKVNALSPFVTGLIVAIVGGLFTLSQDRRNELLKQQEMQEANHQAAQDVISKEQQGRLLELQTIVQLMPYLTSKNESSKQVAITAINELASTSLAVSFARLNKSPGTIAAVRQIAAQSAKEGDRRIAQAALVQLESSDTGPNKTLLKTEEGDCGPEGTGGDNATNLLKNRTDSPPTVRDVTTGDLEDLQTLKVPPRRDNWSSEDLAAATANGDGTGIRLQGYLLRVRKVGRTHANCEFTNYEDWHLEIGSSPDIPGANGILAAAGPRIRISHPNWTLARLQAVSAAKLPVRISGWLFFDQTHLVGQWNYHTLWEIRPAVKIEFLKDQAWLDLDDLHANP
jgi:hypothetical protein